MTRTSLLPSLRKLIPPTGLLRKDLASWYLYDWGASAFTTSVITVFFGPFVTSLASAAADHSGQVHPFGIAVHAGAFYPYIISLSVLLQICLLPILGAIADYSRMKREMLGVFALLGAASVMAMYFTTDAQYLLAGALFISANLSFGAADVFYNSFLPELCGPKER
ncbi:MAG: MFS transporter, partial [Bacteroidetes bacterium]|nr:MFS transporter [Bacteroidota bacterium]